MTCTVTGTLYSPDGTPLPDTRVTIHSPAIYAVAGGASMPVRVEAVTDANGVLTVDLLPGSYTIRWSDACGHYSSPLSVPDAAAIALSDALGLGAGHVPDVGAIIPPGDPGQVVGYDADGKPIPVDMAAAIFPPGVPGQVLAMGPSGPVWIDWTGPPPEPGTYIIVDEDGNTLVGDDGSYIVGVL